MSNEIHLIGPSGQTCDAYLVAVAGTFWNGSALEAFNAGNVATYRVTLTEKGTTGIYEGDAPAALPAGVYDTPLILRSTGRAIGSGTLNWTGSAGSVISPVGALTGQQMRDYVVRGGLVRDDMDTEVYDALTDTILDLDQQPGTFDEREVETASTDVISVAGDYRIDLESDHGNLISVVLKDGTTFGRKLTLVSKTIFDLMFPNPTANLGIGYPKWAAKFAGQLLIGPIPDKTTYVFSLSYSKRLTAPITAATDAVPFSSQYREVLKDGTLWRVFDNLKNFEAADRFGARYVAGKQRILKTERDDKRGALCVLYQDC